MSFSYVPSRIIVPAMIVAFGIYLHIVRQLTLTCDYYGTDILLVSMIGILAVFTWVIDVC